VGASFEDLIKSIKEKLFILDDKTVVYPGHGPLTQIGKEKKLNPFLK
jgi:glyoxylase-like metal-dependent hydrolase (beta-lactamase superfamily II)